MEALGGEQVDQGTVGDLQVFNKVKAVELGAPGGHLRQIPPLGRRGTPNAAQRILEPTTREHAIAAELAPLRFAHSRVTGDEVWAGTLDLGLTGLGVLMAAAPLLKLAAPETEIRPRLLLLLNPKRTEPEVNVKPPLNSRVPVCTSTVPVLFKTTVKELVPLPPLLRSSPAF